MLYKCFEWWDTTLITMTTMTMMTTTIMNYPFWFPPLRCRQQRWQRWEKMLKSRPSPNCSTHWKCGDDDDHHLEKFDSLMMMSKIMRMRIVWLWSIRTVENFSLGKREKWDMHCYFGSFLWLAFRFLGTHVTVFLLELLGWIFEHSWTVVWNTQTLKPVFGERVW